MTPSKSACYLLICCALCGFAASCGGGYVPPQILPLVVSPAALPVAVIHVPYSATLTATGGKSPFTWSIASGTLPPGLSLSASTGVISGTPTAIGKTAIQVKVTDSQTPTAAIDTATKNIIVNGPIAVTTTSLNSGSINVPYGATLAASGGVPPYTWTMASGSLPPGLTLNSGGTITGTPTAVGSSTFTVQAADSETTPETATSGSLSITIGGPLARLSGLYVFSFSGYQSGQPVLQAGTFVADGQGNISHGLMDSNSPAGPQTKLSFSGTYSLDSSNTGPMTLQIAGLGTFTYQIALPASGFFRFIQNGGAGNQGTGTIRPVITTTSITIGSLAHLWSFGANGADASLARYAAVGTFHSASSGAWTNGTQDINDNGTVSSSQSFTGSFVALNSATGRGTATLTNGSSVTTNYSFYPASANEIIMLSTDPLATSAPLSLFTMYLRSSDSFTNATLDGTTVTALQGGGASGGAPYGLLGLVTFDGKGNFTATTDENLGGTLSTNKYSGTYSLAANGRATLSGLGSHPVVYYLFATGFAFALEGDPAVTSGNVVVQFGTSFSNSSLSGSYQGGTLQTAGPDVNVQADSAAADGAGNLALKYDVSGPAGPQQGLTAALTYSVDSTGRAPLLLNGSTSGIAYVASAAGNSIGANPKVFVLSSDANANINSLEH